MKIGSLVLLAGLSFASSGLGASDESPTAIAQQLFDAMKAHDASAASALFLPGATLASISAEGPPSVTPFEKFVERIGSSKNSWLERMWNPKLQEHGAIALLWADYDFHLDGKFSHCGVDTFTLMKTASGWKIAGLGFTRETAGCKPSPLGPPGQQ